MSMRKGSLVFEDTELSYWHQSILFINFHAIHEYLLSFSYLFSFSYVWLYSQVIEYSPCYTPPSQNLLIAHPYLISFNDCIILDVNISTKFLAYQLIRSYHVLFPVLGLDVLECS